MNHLGDTNKMVSGTPISDSTPHNVADLGMLVRRLERLAAVRLSYIILIEAQNDAAIAKIERLTAKVAQLYEGAEEAKQRIKRLEEENNELRAEEARLLNTNGELERRIKRLEEESESRWHLAQSAIGNCAENVVALERLEDALRRIANQDYRGNRSTESQIAFDALKEVKL